MTPKRWSTELYWNSPIVESLALAAAPKEAGTLFQERLGPVKADPPRVARLLADLDAEEFTQREQDDGTAALEQRHHRAQEQQRGRQRGQDDQPEHDAATIRAGGASDRSTEHNRAQHDRAACGSVVHSGDQRGRSRR